MKIRGHPMDPRAWWIAAAFVGLAVGFGSGATAQSGLAAPSAIPSIVVDGSDWMGASSGERRSFLVGVANMMVAETAYAKHHGLATPPASDRIVAAVQHMKLAEIENRITSWYEANPSKQSFPVMGVVWQHLVKQQP